MASFPAPVEYKIVRNVQSVRKYVTELDQSNTPSVAPRLPDVGVDCSAFLSRGMVVLLVMTGCRLSTCLGAKKPLLFDDFDTDFDSGYDTCECDDNNVTEFRFVVEQHRSDAFDEKTSDD